MVPPGGNETARDQGRQEPCRRFPASAVREHRVAVPMRGVEIERAYVAHIHHIPDCRTAPCRVENDERDERRADSARRGRTRPKRIVVLRTRPAIEDADQRRTGEAKRDQRQRPRATLLRPGGGSVRIDDRLPHLSRNHRLQVRQPRRLVTAVARLQRLAICSRELC
jgi:hypothetical protein